MSAGTTTVAPLDFATGTNLTTPAAGNWEYDGTAFYATPIASNRAVAVIEHFVARTGTKTMTSNTALQSIFDNTTGTGGLTSGALTVGAIVKGIFRINGAGTIIPSIQLTTASAAVIGVNTWFKCYPVGTNTVISVGNWA